MSVEPNPPHQDTDVPRPRVRLTIPLALLRILAGPRGRASVRWWAGGFAYHLTATRVARVRFLIDRDPDADGGEDAAKRLRAHLVDNTA